MSLRVLIVPDKFKGTLTAPQAAEAIARGWKAVRGADALNLLPMSDGGDGFGEIVSRQLGAAEQPVRTVDAAHRPCQAGWWWHEPGHTAIVESARVIGLAMLPRRKFHPFELDTFGLGEVLGKAARRGAHRVLVGIGGSATNDGGFGMATALGWHFAGHGGRPIRRWTDLGGLDLMVPPEQRLGFDELTVAVDVQNRLLGPAGSTRVYGPQKGLRLEDFETAEACLGQLAQVAHRQFHRDFAAEPGSGAAGGLGFGLLCFAGAKVEPGFDLFARLSHLQERVKASQLVITGEGAIDHSTLMGKGVGEVARLCRDLKVPCIGLGGVVPERAEAGRVFSAVHALAPDLTTPEDALGRAGEWLERLASKIAGDPAVPPAD